MSVYVKNKKRLGSDYQFFMHQFVDAAKRNGFVSKCDFWPSYKYHIRSLLVRILRYVYILQKRFFPSSLKKKKSILIATNADMLLPNAFPYFYYNIIPMYWDAWPHSWPTIIRHLKFFNCRIVFVSARCVAEMINREIPYIHAYWIPEGIDITLYHKGEQLSSRSLDVFEMGRRHSLYHKILEELDNKRLLKGYLKSNINKLGLLANNKKELTFPNYSDLVDAISKYKVMVCFPQTDTNPERAGDVETLTQRYWEAMLSRCIIIGRAPRELIDLVGYNPVVDVDWNSPGNQLMSILGNINNYQVLVDKNYETALKYASWDVRFDLINHCLHEEGIL